MAFLCRNTTSRGNASVDSEIKIQGATL